MTRPNSRLCFGRLRAQFAVAASVSVLAVSTPAHAEDASATPSTGASASASGNAGAAGNASASGSMPETRGKILLYSLGGVAIVSLGFMGVSLLAREGAVSHQREFPEGGYDCRTSAECGSLASARRDADVWGDRAAVAAGLGIGASISALAVALFWPREASSRTAQTRVSPLVSTSGASLSLQGSF